MQDMSQIHSALQARWNCLKHGWDEWNKIYLEVICIKLMKEINKGEITIQTFLGSKFLSWQKEYGCIDPKGLKRFETVFLSAECSERVPQRPAYCPICKPVQTGPL